MSDCVIFKGIKYCTVNDVFIVGDNSSINGNAISDANPDFIHIPLFHRNSPEEKRFG